MAFPRRETAERCNPSGVPSAVDAMPHDSNNPIVPRRSLGSSWRLGATACVSGCGFVLILIVASTGTARSVAPPATVAGRVKTEPWLLRTKLQFRLGDGAEEGSQNARAR